MMHCKNVVLVVEDNALVRFLTCELFEAAGFVALQADGTLAAVHVLETRDDVGLVVSDLAMPSHHDGIALVELVRKRWRPVKLLVITGNLTASRCELPRDAHLFFKPFNDHVLLKAAEDLLQAA